jgi:hypothetical protein
LATTLVGQIKSAGRYRAARINASVAGGQRRCAAFVQQHGNRLDGLAQPHVVRQTGAQPQPAQIGQPADAAALIGAQFADKAGRFVQLRHLFLVRRCSSTWRSQPSTSTASSGSAASASFLPAS